MKTSIYILVMVLFMGCNVAKQTSKEMDAKPLRQSEMDFIGALEYIQHDNKDCVGDCTFHVSGVFEYFDNCLMVWDSSYFKSLQLDQNMKKSYYPRNFEIKKFGTIYFTKPVDSLDYYFSPTLYDEVRGSLFGQVRKKNGENYSYNINILRDKLYFSSEYLYPSDNCYW